MDVPEVLKHNAVFLYNDTRTDLKVIDSLDAELRKCTSFDFSVAFITQDGVQALLQEILNH